MMMVPTSPDIISRNVSKSPANRQYPHQQQPSSHAVYSNNNHNNINGNIVNNNSNISNNSDSNNTNLINMHSMHTFAPNHHNHNPASPYQPQRTSTIPLLIALIENQEWSQAIQRLRQYPNEASIMLPIAGGAPPTMVDPQLQQQHQQHQQQ